MTRTVRKPFPDTKPVKLPPGSNFSESNSSGGVFNFFQDVGVRETIESIVVAIMLALVFRLFLAEAFIIPTGSMAPSLKGAHKEITSEESGFTYAVGASDEQRFQAGMQERVIGTYCPLTQFETSIRQNVKEHATHSGDRILVNKFVYDFKEPERYDVIVFKYPNNGKQNYIKRLIGLPGDNLLIENGDIYLMHSNPEGGWKREITRKPPAKLRTTLQVVDDTHHRGKRLNEVGWPERWQQFSGSTQWTTMEVGGNPVFSTSGGKENETGWLRYRHYRPNKSDWNTIGSGRLPARFADPQRLPAGQLITDHYAYNDAAYSMRGARMVDGLHWVGDLGIEMDVKILSSTGTLMLDLVEGGTHFRCELDLATGAATLHCDSDKVRFTAGEQEVAVPTATTRLKGPGSYQIFYVNADDQLHLWIDDRYVEFNAATYQRDEIAIPTYSSDDPGDAEPAGIATIGVDVEINRLKIVRDLYYTSVRGIENREYVSNETGEDPQVLLALYQSPEAWSSPQAVTIFRKKKGAAEPMFQLERGQIREKDQFLPCGDNSPQSSDGRIWDGPNYVHRDMLIGRAVFVYWPRKLTSPVRFFPNFKDMRFIR